MDNKTKKLPPIIIIGIVAVVVLAGFCVLLSMPLSVTESENTSFETALFTSVSAFTLNGAAIVNNSLYWSLSGKIFILVLMQISALFVLGLVGVILIKSGNALFFHRRGKDKLFFPLESKSNVLKYILLIVVFTFTFEIVGTLFYSATLIPAFGFAKGLFYSFFTSVSVFTNCGLSILPDNISVLISSNVLFSVTTLLLAISGGFGIFIFADVHNKRYVNIRKNTRFIFIAFAAVIAFSAVIICVLEWNSNAFANLSWHQKIISSLTVSASAKTANINMTGLNALKTPSTIVYMLLMILGGSAGSISGGIEPVVLFSVGVYAVNIIEKKRDISRSQNDLFRNSVAIVSVCCVAVLILTLVLTVSESIPAPVLLFQIISAFFASGAVLAEISTFTFFGKCILMFAMLLGRFGIIYLVYRLNLHGLSASEVILRESEDELQI